MPSTSATLLFKADSFMGKLLSIALSTASYFFSFFLQRWGLITGDSNCLVLWRQQDEGFPVDCKGGGYDPL